MLLQYLLRAFILLVFASSIQLMAQDLSQYRWQNRLILLSASAEDSDILREQVEILAGDVEGLSERKLLVIQLNEQKTGILLPKPQSLELSAKVRERFRTSDKPFSFILIGLDGGVKLRRNEVVSREYLYALIDGMPMRRAEMRENKKKNQP